MALHKTKQMKSEGLARTVMDTPPSRFNSSLWDGDAFAKSDGYLVNSKNHCDGPQRGKAVT